MNRTAPALVLLVTVPLGLIGLRVYQQEVLLAGPSGGSGVVEGTEVALSTRLAARVLEVPVKEGQAVAAGDVLVKLDCADTEAQLAEARARLAAARAQAEAAAAQAGAAAGGASVAKAASEAGRAQAAALAAQRDAAARQAGRLDQQAEDVAAASLDQTRASADALAHQAQAAQASAQATALQAKVASGQATAAEAQAVAALEAVRAGEAGIARLELLAGECVVTAPRAAVVETLPWEVGELVPLGSTVVKLVDLSTVTATFYLPDVELGAAVPGAAAEVVADAYPDAPFAGRVRTVATQAEFTPRNIQTRTDRDRLVFPVEVEIPNPDARLRPGMPVQVTLPGTER